VTGPLDRAIRHLRSLQQPSGCWEGEMVWSPIILAQAVIVHRITGRAPDVATRAGMIRHFSVTRTADGAWGLHPEAPGSMFVTTLAYVALRVLGVAADDPLVAPARRWVRAQPNGVRAIPTWGKLWLALLDLYGWEGVSPCLPELWLLPRGVPFHPVRFYCHTRAIYLGMAALYGRRVRADLGSLVHELRRELYAEPWETIEFARHRHDVTPGDVHVRPGAWLRALVALGAAYERVHARALRRRALARCLDAIRGEQRTTRYQALSPVNGLLNCVALWAESPADPDLAPSLEGLEAWRWSDEAEGIRYAGARSHAWDTAFALAALLEHPATAADAAPALRAGHRFLCETQITQEVEGSRDLGRDPALGGWCFSDGAHRWPVSDCTAEALTAVLEVEAIGAISPGDRLPAERVRQAATFVLARQNGDGGFGTYERRRGGAWLEAINPSEMFGACMTERSYVECTASAIRAFATLRRLAPASAPAALDAAIARAVAFLRSTQRADGSVPGFWGINFTYGLFHFVRGLRAAGVPRDDGALVRAATWLTARQRSDGGWGEHYSSCLTGTYVEHAESQPAQTAWALLALLDVLEPDATPIKDGVAWLEAQQRLDGSWPPGAVNGVFFGSAMLHYRLYPAYFPAWALARHAARVE
jgi:2,3-oxidosqualene cyclase